MTEEKPATTALAGKSASDSPLIFASTPSGYDLPVIDVTNPAFAIADDAKAVSALRRISVETRRKQDRVPKPLMKLFLWFAARRSLLVRAMIHPQESFLDGLSTYVIKLGPDNLVPPFDHKIDIQFAAAPSVTSARIRLSQLAHMTATALAPELAAKPDTPLHIINIAGGAASDSLNTLIVLNRTSSALLNRPVTIHVLDRDTNGPAFGINALAALQQPGNPLAGRSISFRHQFYDWNETAPLSDLVSSLAGSGAIIAAASEGGLFEYGDDDAIIANLRALGSENYSPLISGSVMRNDEIATGVSANVRFNLRPRGLEAFERLVQKAGYTIAASKEALASDQVVLQPVQA